MTIRRPGIDNEIYEHRARDGGPAWGLPGGARAAFCVFIYFESFELNAAPDAYRDPRFHSTLGNFDPRVRSHTLYEYGNRIGMFRVLDALDRHGLTATVAANADACERYPYLVEQFSRRGYEFAAHGLSATNMITSHMSEPDQTAMIERAIDVLRRATGHRPTGWIGQDYGESPATPALLARAGLRYVADWCNDDRPYFMCTTPSLVSLPNQADWDDVQLAWHRQVALSAYRDSVCEAFDVLHREADSSAAFFGLHLHPWFIGWPHRIGYLESVLQRIVRASGVWRATAGQIADQFSASMGAQQPDARRPVS